jgi:diaminohydroxyphosphoribosylaminopyrimidine deaminase/5-amino-6-(5-phosphoribosylamino)uracil reductase
VVPPSDKVRDDEWFMAHVLKLARTHPNTSPNPRVGAVVVVDGEIVAEGVHRGPGTPHAEVAALTDVHARGGTLYVNLEPCNHTGRTRACVPLIVAAGVTRVVAAMSDPDPRVNGRGFESLRANGIEVVRGVLEDQALRLNLAYVHHRLTGRPHVTLKLALTLDGSLAAPDGSSRWITSDETRRRVHAQRSEADAVMVGAGTVANDDPRLTARTVGASRQPFRVIVDSSGRVPADAAVFREPGKAIVATVEGIDGSVLRSWRDAGAEVLVLPRGSGGVDLSSLLLALGKRDCIGVLCEGGPTLAASLLRDDLVDRLQLHYGPKLVGREGVKIGDLGVESMGDALEWRLEDSEVVDGDILVSLERKGG